MPDEGRVFISVKDADKEAILPAAQIVADLGFTILATGGTAAATVDLARKHGARIACCAFVIELCALGGRHRLNGCRVESLLPYK